MQVGVRAGRRALPLPSTGDLKCSSGLSGPPSPLPTLQVPSRITSRVGRIGKARRLPSASASALVFQGRVDGGRQLGTRYPFSDPDSPRPWRTQFLGLSSKPESRGALPFPLAEPSYTCPSTQWSVHTMVELLPLQKAG